MEHPGITKPYNTKNNCNIFKTKFKPQNLNFQLRVETFFVADINYLLFIYLFIYFSLFKVDLQVVKKFLTNK